MIDLLTYCPSSPAIDFRTGEQGWWYEMHIRPTGDTRAECPVCKVKFSNGSDDTTRQSPEGK